MNPSTKAAIIQAIEGTTIACAGLAGLPQTLGPVADILPEPWKVKILAASAVAFTTCKILRIFWPLLMKAFPSIGPLPENVASVAAQTGSVLPQTPACQTGTANKS